MASPIQWPARKSWPSLNSLGNKIEGKIILMYLLAPARMEALSRGAYHVTFIEADKRAAEILKTNAIVLGVMDNEPYL